MSDGQPERQDLTIGGQVIEGTADVVHVISAVTCIKGMDDRGKVCYWTRATAGATLEEAQGMALALLDDIRAMRRDSIRRQAGEDDELTAVKSSV